MQHMIRKQTALNRGQTEHISLTRDLDLQYPTGHGHYLLTCKDQGQMSLGSKARVDTNEWTDGWMDGRTEAIALPDSIMWLLKITEMPSAVAKSDNSTPHVH